MIKNLKKSKIPLYFIDIDDEIFNILKKDLR